MALRRRVLYVDDLVVSLVCSHSFSFLFTIHSILADRPNHEQGGAKEVGAVCESFGSDGSGFGLMAVVLCRDGPVRGG